MKLVIIYLLLITVSLQKDYGEKLHTLNPRDMQDSLPPFSQVWREDMKGTNLLSTPKNWKLL